MTRPSSGSTLAGAMESQPSHASMPAFARNKPSFTQYRAPHGPTAFGQDSGVADSPFSSPASKFDDDLGTSAAGPSSLESSSSGTFSATTGLPNRKRQRNNDRRGQGSTASLSGLGTAMGGNASQDQLSRMQRSASQSQQHRHSLDGASGFAIPGLSDSLASTNAASDDWSLSNTSPQNPPSGSFGPAIGSLSLGSDGSGDDYLPLFNQLQQQNSQQGDSAAFSDNLGSLFGLPQTGSQDPSTSDSLSQDLTFNSIFGGPQPPPTQPTPAQEATARRQVRQDLAAVDQRALRGPLRDLAQSNDVQDTGYSPSPSELQAQMDAALKAAVNDFTAAAQVNRGRLGDSRAPGVGTGTNQGYAPFGTPTNLIQAQQRSLLFPGSTPTSTGDSSILQPFGGASGLQPGRRPSAGPRKRSSSFDASFLPASEPWFSQSPPQFNQLPEQNLGLTTQTAKPGGSGMGTGTGWAGQVTNSFNAFDVSGGNAADQMKQQRRPLTRDRSGLTCSPQETFLNFQGTFDNPDGIWLSQANGFPGLTSANGSLKPQDPSTTGKESVETPKGSAVAPWPGGKPPMNRGDTVRPSQQQTSNQLQPQPHKRGHPSTSSSASSGMSLYSPNGSDTTPSTDDDLDEKPYSAVQPAMTGQFDLNYLNKPGQSIPGNVPPPSRTYPLINGPRFLAPSASSSEDEEDITSRPGTGNSASRGFGSLGLPNTGNNYSGTMLPNTSAPGVTLLGQQTSVPPMQPLGRGRGLQGGYGYMPGSAESGLQIDPSQNPGSAMKTTAVDATMTPANGSELQPLSQDDGSLSPSIRSNAQVIDPPHQAQIPWGVPAQPHQRKAGKAAYGGYPLPNVDASAQSDSSRRSSVASVASDVSSGSQWSGPDAATRDGSNDSEYDPGHEGGATRGPGRPRKNRSGASASMKKNVSRGGGRKAAAASARNQRQTQTPMYGHSVGGGGSSAAGDATASAPSSSAASGGVSHHGSLTVCEYVSPSTGMRCGTEFHRPYDLARHRETIHAKEEATLLRQGKLTREQCRVLYVEVDPEKSQATQEWKCDGKNGCGSVFSRKDALQRHKRLRNH